MREKAANVKKTPRKHWKTRELFLKTTLKLKESLAPLKRNINKMKWKQKYNYHIEKVE